MALVWQRTTNVSTIVMIAISHAQYAPEHLSK